jgi:phosphopantothenoylcysteine decarboxylase / phosphopantothenate---cysteine ligase
MSPSKNILIGITGSIAAFKVCNVISSLRKNNWNVQVIATPSALQFVGEASLEGLSDRQVITHDFVPGKMMSHIDLTRWADVFLIAPATAKSINSLAAGTMDGIIGSSYLAYENHKPLLIAPAMNSRMLSHPATQTALQTLRSRSAQILETGKGELACGEYGDGRMMEAEEIVREVEKSLYSRTLRPKILITIGGTRVPIDSVRSLTNTSTGQTGTLLSEALYKAGFDVTVLAAKNAIKPQLIDSLKIFDTYDDLKDLLETTLRSTSFNTVIHMAAVSDFSVREDFSNRKLSSQDGLVLTLQPTKKIISCIKTMAPNATLIGFKLTSSAKDEDVLLAVQKVFSHGADFVVQNDQKTITEKAHLFSLYKKQGAIAQCSRKEELASLLLKFAIKKSTYSTVIPEVPNDLMS